MRHRSLALLSAIVFCCTPLSLHDALASEALQTQTDEIKSSVLLGPAFEALRELTDTFGPRLTSSPAYRGSAEWAAARFRSFGIREVRFEDFTVPNGWKRGEARGALVSPLRTRLHVESAGWSPPTPASGVEGEVLWLDDPSEANIETLSPRIKDRVVMLDTARIFAGGSYAAVRRAQSACMLLERAGARAVLLPNHTHGNLLGSYVDLLNGGRTLPLPMAEIGMEDAMLIRRLGERGPVKVQLSLENHVSGPVQEPNVIAEIRGSERPDEWILVGGHLDSWDYGSGASDNGAGSVAILDAARAIAALDRAPRRSIRFVLWGGEEPGQLGSLQYARAHADELKNVVAVLNTDTGAGRPKGWRVGGRLDLQAAMQPLANAYLRDLAASEILLDTTCSTDHCAFLLRGVPTLNLLTDRTLYEQVIHRTGDTFDKINAVDLKAVAAVVAVTTYVLAQHPQPIARHLEHAEVSRILTKAGLVDGLTWLGRWQPEETAQ